MPRDIEEVMNDLVAAVDSGDVSGATIAEVGVRVIDLLLRKNRDYGESAFKRPILSPDQSAQKAIEIRMSDKVSRLAALAGPVSSPGIDESRAKTMADLVGYGILWLVMEGVVRSDAVWEEK